MHHDDMDDPGPGWIVISVILAILALVLLFASFGCATAPAPSPEEVIPCDPIMVYPPLIEVSARPALTSAGWTREQVEADPLAFARAVATDLASWIGWGLGMEADITASNGGRPDEHGR